MTSNVTALFGQPTGEREVNETCVKTLRQWLEMAEAGEIVGVSMAGLCADGLARYAVAGRVGGYSMLGAMDVAKAELLEIVRDD